MTLLRELRMERGLSQKEVAERAGLSVRTIQFLEAGQTTPTIQTLAALKYALGRRGVLKLLDEVSVSKSKRGRPRIDRSKDGDNTRGGSK